MYPYYTYVSVYIAHNAFYVINTKSKYRERAKRLLSFPPNEWYIMQWYRIQLIRYINYTGANDVNEGTTTTAQRQKEPNKHKNKNKRPQQR